MFEAKNDKANDFVEASKLKASSVLVHPIAEALKAEEQLFHSVKEETEDQFLDGSSSLPVDDPEASGPFVVTEVMTKEEEKLYEARVKVEEEEEAKRKEEAARLAFDPNARFSKLDELLTQTQLYSEFLLEKMEEITDV
jgi:ATP-dependent DNA helicase